MDSHHGLNPRLVSVAGRDARILSIVGRRQVEWDPLMATRVTVGESALAVYSILPMQVMCALAVPADVSPAAVDADVIVSFASLVRGIDSALDEGEDVRFDVDSIPSITATVGQGLTLACLPPREAWQMPIHGLSSDLTPSIRDAVEEFRLRSAGMSQREASPIAEEIWSRTAWAGLPMRVLHAARRLRLLTDEPLRLTASTCGPWKRLSTPRGQIFSYTAGIEARLGLRVVG